MDPNDQGSWVAALDQCVGRATGNRGGLIDPVELLAEAAVKLAMA